MAKPKIVLCSNLKIDDPKSWSGTHHNLFRAFENKGLLDGTIVYKVNDWPIQILSKFFFLKRGTRDFFASKYYERKLLSIYESRENLADSVLFHVSEFTVPKEIVGKVRNAVYMDATLQEILKYRPPGRFFVKAYLDYFYRKERYYLAQMDHIFTMNEWSRKSLISEYGISDSKVHNVGFGINVDPFTGHRSYGKNLLIVLRRGLEKPKGLDLLLEAFKYVRLAHTDARLNVVGTTYREMDGVTYYEGFPRTKTIELFRQSDLYVMPALLEVNGITYLEALANKVPIIGLNRFAFPEFSQNGKFGFIVESEDARLLAEKINFALSNPGILLKMGEEGQKATLDRYTWDMVTASITEILEN